MSKKLFTVVEVSRGQKPIRIQLDTDMGLKPGDRFSFRPRPDGVIEMIPADMETTDFVTTDYQNAIITGFREIKNKVVLLNERIDAVTALIIETKKT